MSEYVERTFVALKPDAVKRGITGEIISQIEDTGLKIMGLKMVQATDQLLEQHYEEHVDKPFYEGLAEYMKEGPIVAMVVEGVHAVENMRKIIGDTDAKDAHPATIRGQYAHMSMDHADESGGLYRNIIHASATAEEAEKEVGIWFSEDELHEYQSSVESEVR
ncbi:nucleoside-diphosphate kinase [Candidatus Nanosalina sp. VS9-1]|uniref:nucleoside-diphosphate kinase n=1 Tax=Candidatus Nanosalina sp. VS9-1 TaxID=3388566 RepID=UPI0039DFBEBD